MTDLLTALRAWRERMLILQQHDIAAEMYVHISTLEQTRRMFPLRESVNEANVLVPPMGSMGEQV